VEGQVKGTVPRLLTTKGDRSCTGGTRIKPVGSVNSRWLAVLLSIDGEICRTALPRSLHPVSIPGMSIRVTIGLRSRHPEMTSEPVMEKAVY
jgi:hypothetical protein